jgi:DNA-binding SARP family transcriptional activator
MEQAEQEATARPSQPAAYGTLFGPFQLRAANGHEIEISNRRARAILALLCVEAGQPINRDYLSKLLWPGPQRNPAVSGNSS